MILECLFLVVLTVIAGAMLMGKTLQIRITHDTITHTPEPTQDQPVEDPNAELYSGIVEAVNGFLNGEDK